MRPRNFPARKLARQIAADMRGWATAVATTAERIYSEDVNRGGALTAARNIRTKKRRATR